jgi:putative ABC transport system permease protein
MMPFKLATKEMLRAKFRFAVVALIVALITVLVLLQVAMAEGLTVASSQYIAGLDAELILFRDKAKTVIPASSLGNSELNSIRRVEGIKAVGPIGFSTASILLKKRDTTESFEVALIGVEPGMPGAPPVFAGTELADERAMEVILDQNVLNRVNVPVGSMIDLQVQQGLDAQVYSLMVVGHTGGKKYTLPSIFVPLRVWDKIKPQERRGGGAEIIFNVVAVKLKNPAAGSQMANTLESQVHRIKAADLKTAYESLPGYREMQDIMGMMQGFVTLVAMLVIGVFFQIQALQKIAQVGMLKAIGASNRLVTFTLLTQVMLVTLAGIAIGGTAVWGITASLPPTVPVVFNGPKVAVGIATLFLMGPMASFFAVRTLLQVEPLKALGLAR